jgi:hypothetical protein
VGDISNVADLVAEFDELRATREMGCVLDLSLLPLGLRECLVIRHLRDQARDAGPEGLLEFCFGRGCVLDRVVENGGLKDRQIRDSSDASDDLRDLDRMIDVGRSIRVLATIIAMPIRREQKGGEQGNLRKRVSGVARNVALPSSGCASDRGQIVYTTGPIGDSASAG